MIHARYVILLTALMGLASSSVLGNSTAVGKLLAQVRVPSSAEILATLGQQQIYIPKFATELVDKLTVLASNSTIAAEIDALIEVGNLQEIVWRLREEGMLDKADQLEKYLSNELATAEIISRQDIGAGSNNSQLLELANGMRAVCKTGISDCGMLGGGDIGTREVALYKLDQLIGTNVFPVTVARTIDGNASSIQLFIENAASAKKIVEWRKGKGEPSNVPGSKAINTLRLLGNDSDRNYNNYLYPVKGRVFAVDGEYSFTHHDIFFVDNNYENIIDKQVIEWQDLWEHFRVSQNRRLEDLPASVLQKIEPIFSEIYRGYLADADFMARLEKITSEQVDAIIFPIVESMAEGNIAIRKSFNKMLELQNREGAPKQWLREIRLEYDNIKDIYRQIYRHLVEIEIKEKMDIVYYNIEYRNALALSQLRQRILAYIDIVKSSKANMEISNDIR